MLFLCCQIFLSIPWKASPEALVAVPQMKHGKCSLDCAAGKLLSPSRCEAGRQGGREDGGRGLGWGRGWMHRLLLLLLGFIKFYQVLEERQWKMSANHQLPFKTS